MILLAAGIEFGAFTTTFLEKCDQVYWVMALCAFAIALIGILKSIYDGLAQGDVAKFQSTVVQLVLVCITIGFLKDWIHFSAKFWGESVLDAVGAKPEDNFKKLWDNVGQSWQEASIFSPVKLGLTFGLLMAMVIAAVLLFIAYLIDFYLLEVCLALSPAFVAMLMTPLASQAKNFLLALVGFTMWPLGWGIASLLTEPLIDAAYSTGDGIVGLAVSMTGFKALIYGGTASLWIIISTIMAPVLIQKLLTSGLDSVTSAIGPAAAMQPVAAAGGAAAMAGLAAATGGLGAGVAGSMGSMGGGMSSLGGGAGAGASGAGASPIGSAGGGGSGGGGGLSPSPAGGGGIGSRLSQSFGSGSGSGSGGGSSQSSGDSSSSGSADSGESWFTEMADPGPTNDPDIEAESIVS